MKRALSILVCLILVLLSCAFAAQAEVSDDGFSYRVSADNLIVITGYTGALTQLTIPDTIEGKSVNRIGDYAFYGCENLTGITLPVSLESIGTYAFFYCARLTDITIPDGVTDIGEFAFALCYNLSGITIPGSVRGIGEGAFYGCDSLSGFSVSVENPFYTQLNGVLFDKTRSMLHTYPCGKTDTAYIIPDSTLVIGKRAFQYCDTLTDIILPDGTAAIEAFAFDTCTSLKEITIPGSINSIGEGAFNSCVSLKDIFVSLENPV